MTPNLTEFRPLPTQWQVLRDIKKNFDYDLGTHEVLLSGSVGSAKTLLLAHLACAHALAFPGAHVGIGRRTKPELKETLVHIIYEHLDGIIDQGYNKTTANFKLPNGSRITSFSWADGSYKKFRSHEFSMFLVEELTENDRDLFYQEMYQRVGRDNGIKEKIICAATNPDDPSHWAYKRWFIEKKETRHVYFSKTSENPYLPESYVEQLEANLDPQMARRMLYGEWLSIAQDVIYYAYDRARNYVEQPYKVDNRFPIHLCFDFNIGEGKPMSACLFQKIGNIFHVFAEVIVLGSRTQDQMEEMAARGLLDYPTTYIINGDATGKRNDTRSVQSDYDIIKKFLANYRPKSGRAINFEMKVPMSNPPIRTRHNILNAQFLNEKGQVRLFVHNCKTVDEGLRLTKLKPGAQYLEDDSKAAPYQHVTTALGYGVVRTLRDENVPSITMHQAD